MASPNQNGLNTNVTDVSMAMAAPGYGGPVPYLGCGRGAIPGVYEYHNGNTGLHTGPIPHILSTLRHRWKETDWASGVSPVWYS